MFKDIFKHEFKYWLKKPAPYIYFIGFFAFAFLSFIGSAGIFDPEPTTTKTVRVINSPYEINYMLQYFTKIFLFLLPAIIGASIHKDFKYRMHSIVYTFPINKANYLFGKFLSAFCIVALISFSVGIAFFVGEHMPGLHGVKITTLNISGYVQAYLLYVLPTLFFFGSIVFAVVAFTRNIYAGFITVILIFLFQLIVENALGSTGQLYLMSILDPFAQNTKEYAIQNWTLLDRNIKLIPISTLVLLNRGFWSGIAILAFVALQRKFTFSENATTLWFKKQKAKVLAKVDSSTTTKVRLAKVGYDFSWKHRLKSLWKLSTIEFHFIIKSWMFLVLVFFGIVAVFFAIAKITNFEEIAILPVTRVVLTIPAIFFTSIMILITFLYSGMLVQRSKTSGMNQLVDSTAMPNWVFLFSKILALLRMQMILLLILMTAGIMVQVWNGYYNFEIGLYLFRLYIITFPVLIVWSFLAVFVQTLFTNTYLGLFILIIGWLGIGGLPQAGITSKLLLVNAPPGVDYSDMNGYAEALKPYFLVQSYWFVFGLIFLVLTLLLWVRGIPESFKERFKIVSQRLKKPVIGVLGVFLICFGALGFAIHNAENQGNSIFSSGNGNDILNNFKVNFNQYSKIKQPRITKMKLELGFFPEANEFKAKGSYILVNKTKNPIDTLLVKTGFDEKTTFKVGVGSTLIVEDTIMKFRVIRLHEQLLPQDSTELSFTIENTPNTLFERNSNVLKNGTFLLSDFFPRLGYSFGDAKKYPSDSTALVDNYGAIDSDLIDFEAIVSTSEDQIAIAPGYPIKQWKENDRNYFQYKLSSKIKFVLGFNSGRFEIKKERYKDVEFEIYHHKEHTYNLSEMMNGLKAAYDYNTKYFAPYQHRQARIIEFPESEGSYATTMANSIPMSEIRFIANTDTTQDKVDLAFYVSAHELTHQWWGAQVAPANALGARMLTESISEYVTLNIYKETYGPKVAQQFLKKQRERYLKGRTDADEKEPPLSLAAEQQYIFYGKGAMAFNAMGYYLGEQRLNGILKDFLLDYRLQEEPPYPTSLELLQDLKKATPDSLQYVIKDAFETVTFYDNKIENAQIKALENGKYQIEIDFSMRKYLDNASEISLPLADYIEIGVFDADDKVIHIKSHKITKEQNKLILSLEKEPIKVALDPNYILIDKNMEDNELEL